MLDGGDFLTAVTFAIDPRALLEPVLWTSAACKVKIRGAIIVRGGLPAFGRSAAKLLLEPGIKSADVFWSGAKS